MSRAFVKEDSEGRWTPPAQSAEYRVWLIGATGPELVHENDDFFSAVEWVSTRPSSGFEVRSREGRLLAAV